MTEKTKQDPLVTFTVGEKTYLVDRPNLDQQMEGQKVYNRAFSDAVQSGALIRPKLEDFMKQQNLWDENKQKEFLELNNKTLSAERKLAKGGFKLSEAKALAIELRRFREQMRQLIEVRSQLDIHTAEGQADNQRFNYWVSVCLVYNNTKKPVYSCVDDYLKAGADDVATQAAQGLAKILYGLSDNFESKLPENQFLKEFKFVDDELRLVNDEGNLVDEEGNLIDEEGKLVNSKGESVDAEGNLLDEDGNYLFDRKPFLDDDDKPIVKDEPKVEVKSKAKDEPKLEEVSSK